jgi:serine/threonine protein kinase
MIVTGIVLAMRYVHSQKIIHGNLNPSNVFIDWNWIIRIGGFNHSQLADDFGLAFDKEITTLTSMHLPDVRYAAPNTSRVFQLSRVMFSHLV